MGEAEPDPQSNKGLTAPVTYSLTDRGRVLLVQIWRVDGKHRVRLSIDDVVIDEKSASNGNDVSFEIGAVENESGTKYEQKVKVSTLVSAYVGSVKLIESKSPTSRGMSIDFVPPLGTRARRKYDRHQRHPYLYAARHVASAVIGILAGLLGFGLLLALIRDHVLNRISFDWLPSVSMPEWLKYLNPFYWLGRLLPDDLWRWLPDWRPPAVTLPGWLEPAAEYIVPVVIAIMVGLTEVRRRRKRQRQEDQYSR